MREGGFTLAESLVAMFIFALAAVALVQMQAQSARTFSRVETRALARMVAENSLVDEMARRDPPVLGSREGETELGNRKWRWRVEIAATSAANTFRIQSQAFAEGAQDASASITAFKAAGGGR
jgi:general secretion pathway protein I